MHTNPIPRWQATIRIVALAVVCLLAIGPAGGGRAYAAELPRNIILFIGDGMGMNHVQAASLQKAVNDQLPPVECRLSFEEFPVTGYLTTHSANMPATDSAAGGTALACGVKTQNGVIGKGTDGKDVDSVAAIAKKKGKAVGIITSVAIDDATPACFYGHAVSRNEREQLLEQAFGGAGFDVLMCGGVMTKGWNNEKFADKCKSAGLCYLTAETLAGFSPAAAGERRVFGYFDANGDTMLSPMATRAAEDPEPRLTTMTRKTLEILTSRAATNGFFLMVEGGAIDKFAHANDTPNMIGEVLELHQSVADTIAFLKERNLLQDTLVVVTADHETGGLSFAENRLLNQFAQSTAKGPDGTAVVVPAATKIGKVKIGWTLDDHTCAWVPLFALGPQAQRFAGRHDNTDVAAIINQLMP